MKYFFAILVVICTSVAFFSCENDDVRSTGIYGEWIWEKSVSPLATLTPENSGEQRMLNIDDFIYREIINDVIVFESQYDLIIRMDSLYGDQKYIVFPSGYEEGIDISGSELIRTEAQWFDGFKHYYHRKR